MDNLHERIRKIESGINLFPFGPYDMGSTLNDLLITQILNHGYSDDLFSCVKNATKCILALLFPSQNFFCYSSYPTGLIVFTWLNERAELRDLVVPLVKRFGPKKALVIGNNPQMIKTLPQGTPFLPQTEVANFCRRDWHRRIDRYLLRIGPKIVRTLLDCGFSPTLAPLLLHGLITQTQRVLACENLLGALRPKAIVTEYDRSDFSSCLVLAARRRKIPTMTMVHGVVNPYPAYGYFPVLADKVFCWGDRQKEQFLNGGVPQEKLLATGCQRLEQRTSSDRGEVRSRLGIAPDTTLVILATNPIDLRERRKLAQSFADGIKGIPQVTGLVRLHPGENVKDYDEFSRENPSILVQANSMFTVDEILAAADFVVSHNSGFATDALIKRASTVILDTISLPLLNAKNLVDFAGCPHARSSAELNQVLSSLISNGPLRNILRIKADHYIRSLFRAFGNEATDRVSNAIDDFLRVPLP